MSEYVLRRAPISYDKFELLLVIVEDIEGETTYCVQWNKPIPWRLQKEDTARIGTYTSLIGACEKFDQVVSLNTEQTGSDFTTTDGV